MTQRLEKYEATVTNIDDPDMLGRIKVACVGLMGDEETEIPQWVEPNLQWGWFVVPDVGEMVEIEEKESPDHDDSFGQSSIENMDLRWTGRRTWTSESTDQKNVATPIPEEFKNNYPKRRGFKTPNGHLFFFDDTDGLQKINLVWHQKGKYQYITMDENGSTIIANKNGSMIYLNSKDGEVTIIDEHGNNIVTCDTGIKIVDKNSNFIELNQNFIQIVSQKNITLLGSDVTLKSATVNLLDNANDKVIKGDTFKSTVYDVHTHATAFGPSGPPTPLLLPGSLSQNCKVGS
jgi:hypothetical protein